MNRKDADTARTTGPTPAEPNGCRHCGQPQRTHFQRWWGPPNHPEGPGWHGWTEPTDEQRKARMLSRRLGPSGWRDDGMPPKETPMDTGPRASQAAGDANGAGDDAGAAHDSDVPAAALSALLTAQGRILDRHEQRIADLTKRAEAAEAQLRDQQNGNQP